MPQEPRDIINDWRRFLCCPRCGANVVLDETNAAHVRCAASCGIVATIRDGVIDFVAVDHDDRGSMKGFGYQWSEILKEDFADNVIYGHNLGSSKELITKGQKIDAASIAGLRAIDIGCGHGNYSRALAAMGAKVLAVDLSESVYRCAEEERRRSYGDITFMRADVLNLPFAPGSADMVLSIGMAHHTPDPQRAVRVAAECVKPGGRLLLYLYEPRAVGYVTLRHLFPLPHYVPNPLLLLFCRLLAVPVSIYLSLRRRSRLNVSFYRNVVLGLFDAYGPEYSFVINETTIRQWMVDCGFTDIIRPMSCLYSGVRTP